MNKEVEQEYLLLRNYKEHGLFLRGILTKIPMFCVDMINSNYNPFGRFDEQNRKMFRAALQIDVISKIMMYIEDLAVLSESFRKSKPFYQLLDENKIGENNDLGKTIEEFFNRIDSFTTEDLCKIASYINPDTIQDENSELIKKHITNNCEELRRVLKLINDFGKTNHPLFKRFKHAGFPIVPAGSFEESMEGLLKNFESCSLVSIGNNPLEDVIPIPYSNDVMQGYHIIVHGMQWILLDIVTNRIMCIEREIPRLIPNQSYKPTAYNSQEGQLLTRIIESFYTKNPIKPSEKSFNFQVTVDKDKISWYLNLPSFLEECKKYKIFEDEFTKSKTKQNHQT